MREVHFPGMWNQCLWIRLSRNSFWNSGGGGWAATSCSVMRGDILLFTPGSIHNKVDLENIISLVSLAFLKTDTLWWVTDAPEEKTISVLNACAEGENKYWRKSRVLNHTAENKSYFVYLIFVLFYDWLVKIFWFPIQVGQILTSQPKDNVYPKGELVKEDVLISNLSGFHFGPN